MKNITTEIDKLYEFALSLNNEHILIDICPIDAKTAQKIAKETGNDYTGYFISIDNYSIKHTLEKHGNPIKEAKRGQIHITKEDFLLLPEIILNFDTVKYEKKGTKESLLFEKKIKESYFVVKEIRTVRKKSKKNRIILQTMYKRKTPLT